MNKMLCSLDPLWGLNSGGSGCTVTHTARKGSELRQRQLDTRVHTE